MKKGIIQIAVVILIILLFAFNYWGKNQEIKTVKMGNAVINVEIADTETERTGGLSDRKELGENEGMLFVFDKEGYYGFWMKDMKFSIDIAWLDKDKKIINVENAVGPETYPKVFIPPSPNLYVLEIPAGFLSKNKAKIGDLVAF